MGRVSTLSVEITPGDCDPIGVLCTPRVQCWIDAAAANFFARCALADWGELRRRCGIVGVTPLEQHARFVRRATIGERLTISTEVRQWRAGDFVQRHVARRDDTLIFECVETRAFVALDPAGRTRVCVVPVPQDIRALCG
jgi:4-hydroxybenzoyl-CoA thioesterase